MKCHIMNLANFSLELKFCCPAPPTPTGLHAPIKVLLSLKIGP